MHVCECLLVSTQCCACVKKNTLDFGTFASTKNDQGQYQYDQYHRGPNEYHGVRE